MSKSKAINEDLSFIRDWLVNEMATRLGLTREDIDLDNDLINYGLDSLHFQEIIGAIEQQFSIQLSDEALIDNLNLRSLIRLIFEQRKTTLSSLYSAEELARFNNFICYEPYQTLIKMKNELGDIFFDRQEALANDTCIIDGRELINFTSYNYLGYSGDSYVIDSAYKAMLQYGTSVSASRMVSGEKNLHQQLENEIAELVRAEAALVFTTGHATNVNTIAHLMGPQDLILYDELAHNSLIQGALYSGAKRLAFPHNNYHALDSLLQTNRNHFKRVLIIIEGLYSMDGDIPDLNEFIAIKTKYLCWLMIDEAHSIGVLGATGGGIREHCSVVSKEVDIWMGTLSKAFASCGGYVAGKKELIEYLKYTCPGFIYSVGMTPANAGAALAAIQLLKKQPQRVNTLKQLCMNARKIALDYNFDIGLNESTPILPLIFGSSKKTIMLSRQCFEHGINIKPIIYPAVPEESARLRMFLTYNHKPEQIDYALTTLKKLALNFA